MISSPVHSGFFRPLVHFQIKYQDASSHTGHIASFRNLKRNISTIVAYYGIGGLVARIVGKKSHSFRLSRAVQRQLIEVDILCPLYYLDIYL